MTNLWHKIANQATGAQCMCPAGTTITAVCALKLLLGKGVDSKIKTKQDDGDVFWWMFGHVSLLKREKDVKDDNRYSVLQTNIISSRKYCDLMSIVSNEYNTSNLSKTYPSLIMLIVTLPK